MTAPADPRASLIRDVLDACRRSGLPLWDCAAILGQTALSLTRHLMERDAHRVQERR